MSGKDVFDKQNRQKVGHCSLSTTLRKLSDVPFSPKQIPSLATSKSDPANRIHSIGFQYNHEQKPQDIHASPEPNKKVINHPFFSQDKLRL